MADFSQPGDDGILPADFTPWRWGVTYTVRPAFLSPLRHGREYIVVSRVVRRLQSAAGTTNYSSLYDRATAIAKARIERLTCCDDAGLPHCRVVTRGWYRHENVGSAFVAIGLVCLRAGEQEPQGMSAPTPEELSCTGEMPRESDVLSRASLIRNFDEGYTDVDVREHPKPAGDIFMVSYGEYLEQRDGMDYEPFVERAEELARFCGSFAEGSARSEGIGLNIVRREWMCATIPDIAVIHVYLRI